MEVVPQLAYLAPVADTGAADTAGTAPDQAVAAAFQLSVGVPEPAADESTATARNLRRVQRGETLPDGGNLLPLVVGLLPPVTSLAASAAPADAPTSGGTPTQLIPPALASLTQALRPSVERGSKSAPPPAASPFDHLLASNLPAEARAAIAAALEASAGAGGGRNSAASLTPQPSNPVVAGTTRAEASAAMQAPLAPSPGDVAADVLSAPVSNLPPLRTPMPAQDAASTPGLAPAEHHDSAAAASAAEPITLEHALPTGVTDTVAAQPEHGVEIAAAAEAPPPAFTHLLPGAPRAAEGGAVMNLATPVGSAGWSDAVGERVAWLVQQDLGQAHLKLNPPQLGPVEVRVQINGDQAAVSFTAHNQQTRDALNDASQRLRDLLGAQGFVNVQVDVGQQPFQERPMLFAPYEDDAGPPAVSAAARTQHALPAARGVRALLDAYA